MHWFDIDRYDGQLDNTATVLSNDEDRRASRYRFEQDRRRYVLVRAALRYQLGSYLDLAPVDLEFTYSDAGKPLLAADSYCSDISFNVSHSGSLGLIAIGLGCQVGVDVEYMKRDLDYCALARHSFSTDEQIALKTLTGADRTMGFYRCWTRKEAYIKALGDGIAYGLDRFDVSLDVSETRVIADRNFDGKLQWKYTELLLNPEYAAVVIADMVDYKLESEELDITSIFR